MAARQTHSTSDVQSRAEEAAEDLLDTCQDLGAYLDGTDESDLMDNDDFCEALDERVLKCDDCGWWVEPHETGDDGRCEDCSDEEG